MRRVPGHLDQKFFIKKFRSNFKYCVWFGNKFSLAVVDLDVFKGLTVEHFSGFKHFCGIVGVVYC